MIFCYRGSSTHRLHEGPGTIRKGHLTQDEGGELIPTRGHFVITKAVILIAYVILLLKIVNSIYTLVRKKNVLKPKIMSSYFLN